MPHKRKDRAFRGAMLGALLTGVLCLSSACSDPAPPPPSERSNLPLEIFDLLDRKDYAGAIPKIERLEKLDETNEFMTPFLALVRQNAVLKEAKSALNHGNYEKADRILSAYKFTESDAIKKARADVKTLLRAKRLGEELAKEKLHYSRDLRAQAEELAAFIRDNPDFKDLKPLVDSRLAHAQRLAQLEREQTIDALHADAVRAFQEGNYELGNTLTQILALEGKDAEAHLRDLRRRGAFM